MADGKVVVVGGYNSHTGAVLASTEVYDPTTGLWTSARSIRGGHWLHTETLLTDGSLLVVGGRQGFSGDSFSEIFLSDEAGKLWRLAGELNYARHEHTATLLQNGNLLIAGGEATSFGPAVPIAELIEPVNTR